MNLACLLPLLSASHLQNGQIKSGDHTTTEPHNANHIFNAIHSSGRQWGSSVYHNGMSFFLASVPIGTQFYHGTGSAQPVTGVEWLAFEPEHALGFARPRGRRPPGGHDPSQERRLLYKTKDQKTFDQSYPYEESNEDGLEPGYVHTYVTAKDLRLLYIDGMAAGKTDKGTLDSQDLILLNTSFAPGGGFGETDRAEKACKIASERWDNHIDGFLRMEAGFEIILCSFERDLNVVRITQARYPNRDGNNGQKRRAGANSWLQAVAARYHGIGGDRFSINFDQFVTAYSYGLDLFTGNDSLPRLNHLSAEELKPIRKDIDDLVLSTDALEASFNWQGVVDMIITRYSDELQFLISGEITSTSSFHAEVERLLEPFIDYGGDSGELVIDRCSKQFTSHRITAETLASKVVQSISHSICAALFSALQLDLDTAVTKIKDLTTYLSWTTWKECRGCDYGELCIIPMWPMGTVDDYEHPICQAHDRPLRSGESYWGGPHRVPP